MSFINKFSSRVDYPQEALPEDLWEDKDGEYQLKPNVVNAIKNMVDSILTPRFKSVNKWIVTYLLGSSIATQFWKEDSDLDIKIVIDAEKFKASNPEYIDSTDAQLKEQFLEIFDEHKGKKYFAYGKRPMDMYLVIDREVYTKDFQKRFDALYDVISKRWIKNPKLYDIDSYDRDEVIEEGESLALKWAEKWDLDIGKILRKVKEVELIQNYIKTLNKNRAAKFKQKVENLLFALEQDIKKMHTEKNFVKDEYHKAYDEYNPDIEHYYDSINSHPYVIRMKMLNLWGYVYIIKQLSDFIKDNNEITPKDIKKIKKVVI